MEENPKGVVLIVDDNSTNLGVLFEYLSNIGFRVLLSPDGESALEQVEYAQPDIILLDVMMPGIDGFETCLRLKENDTTRDIPVIFMTALSDTFNKVRGFEVGGVDYITKPFQYKEVLARVNTHLTIRNLQKKLQEQNEMLVELNASKDRFFSIIAHDLRSPFSAFLVGTELLSNIDSLRKEKVEIMAREMRKSAERLYRLIENLLGWAEMQMGSMAYQPESFQIETIINRSLELLLPNAQNKGIELVSHVDSKVVVYVDQNMIDAVIRNLISNAIKFTDEGGKITVSAKNKDDFIEIIISDTGVGIGEENVSKLFRIDTKYKTDGTAGERGTGLGLIFCKELVEKNQGEIWVESVLGEGTTFHFSLPKPQQS